MAVSDTEWGTYKEKVHALEGSMSALKREMGTKFDEVKDEQRATRKLIWWLVLLVMGILAPIVNLVAAKILNGHIQPP